MRGLSEHSIIIRGSSFRSTGGVSLPWQIGGPGVGLETTISACFPDFRPLRGRRTRFPDVFPARPDLFDAVWRVFRTETTLFSTAFLAFWAARVISGPPATFQTKGRRGAACFSLFLQNPRKMPFSAACYVRTNGRPVVALWRPGEPDPRLPAQGGPTPVPEKPKTLSRHRKILFAFLSCARSERAQHHY